MTNWVYTYEYAPPQSALTFSAKCAKRGYDSEAAAQAALLAVAKVRRRKSHGKRRQPHEAATYRCTKCGRWHLTSMAQ